MEVVPEPRTSRDARVSEVELGVLDQLNVVFNRVKIVIDGVLEEVIALLPS